MSNENIENRFHPSSTEATQPELPHGMETNHADAFSVAVHSGDTVVAVIPHIDGTHIAARATVTGADRERLRLSIKDYVSNGEYVFWDHSTVHVASTQVAVLSQRADPMEFHESPRDIFGSSLYIGDEVAYIFWADGHEKIILGKGTIASRRKMMLWNIDMNVAFPAGLSGSNQTKLAREIIKLTTEFPV